MSTAHRLSLFDLELRARLDARSSIDPDRTPRAAETVTRITPWVEPAPVPVQDPLQPA